MKYIVLLICLLVINFTNMEAQKSPKKSNTEKSVALKNYIKFWYFHGDKGCGSCGTVEKMAEKFIKEKLGEKFSKGEIKWEVVNYDKKNNEHYIEDFKLDNQTLLITKYVNNKVVYYKALEEVWKLYNKEQEFNNYLQAELDVIFPPERKRENLLWEVKSEQTTVYVLGSIHKARPDFYPLPNALDSTFNLSKYLVVEFDLNKANPFELLQRAYFQDTMTLEKALKPSTYQKLKEFFKSKEINELVYYKMKPWFASIFIQTMDMAEENGESALGIDQYFLQKLDTNKMQIKELESFEEQLSLFETMGNMEDYLVSTIDEIKEDVDDGKANKIFDAWKYGAVDELNSLINEQANDPQVANLMNKLLFERNNKMTQKIEEYLNDDKVYFVIAGAAHLIGENGIISQLQKMGRFQIKRL